MPKISEKIAFHFPTGGPSHPLAPPLRSTMKDERLKDLIVLACEKDLTDTIELQNVVKTWSQVKTRRISRK